MAANAKNRFLRALGGRYDFVRRIPSDLRPRFGGRAYIVRSVGAVPYPEALERARRLAAVTDRLFRMVARKPDLTADQIAELVEDWFARRVASQDAWRKQHSFGDAHTRERAEHIAEQRADGAMELIRLNDTGSAAEAVQALLDARGIEADPTSPTFQELSLAVLRANAEAARIHAARMRGDFTIRPADPLLDRALTAEKKPKKAVPTFGDAFDRFAGQKASAGAWQADMQRENSNTRALFVEAMGDKAIDRYERTDISEFVAMLHALPALRGKSPAFRGKTLAELVAMTKADPRIECLSPKSIKKHASNVSSFFAWCVDQGWIGDNPAKGVFKAPKRTVRRSEERNAWTPEQLHTLFTSPVYHGCKSAFFRAEPGAVVIRDSRYWLPLLGAFHPVRLEEVAQLRLEDVQEQDGVTFLNIRGDDGDGKDGEPGRKVKTLAAWRKVPLHHIVIDLGFLTHIEDRRKAGERMVFPDLKPGGVAKRYGFSFSKWFGNYRKAIGLEAVDFHGFRHAAITALQRANAHPDLIDQLDGHQAPGERSRYGKGFELPALKAAIDGIAYLGITAKLIQAK